MLASQAISESAYSYGEKSNVMKQRENGGVTGDSPLLSGGNFGREGGLSRREETSAKAISCR